MARLRSADTDGLFVSRALSEPSFDPLAHQRNGRYRGRLPLRRVPQGVSGSQLSSARPDPAPGQIWGRQAPAYAGSSYRRQRVEIVEVVPPVRAANGRGNTGWVVFRELTFGQAVRRLRTAHFLRTSRPETDR